ncbi:hypothetical protein EDC04DRAFT_2601224 [Pisolithus marmoratus]|nr:hypothetical protein EDC04DRAFT_2601224 [Pisolithus marmoratus]
MADVPVWFGDTGMDGNTCVVLTGMDGCHQVVVWVSHWYCRWAWMGESPGSGMSVYVIMDQSMCSLDAQWWAYIPVWFGDTGVDGHGWSYQGGSKGSVSQLVVNTQDGGHTWVVLNVGVPMGGGGMGQSDGEKAKPHCVPALRFHEDRPTLCSGIVKTDEDIIITLVGQQIFVGSGALSVPASVGQQIFLGLEAQSAPASASWALSVPVSAALGFIQYSIVWVCKTSGRGALYTFQPTKTRRGKLTHKEVDAQHLYLPSGSQPSTPRTPRTMGSSENLNFSDFPNSVGIPNSDWNDVEDPHQSRRHTKSQNDIVREWLPWRAEYLNVILEGEQLAKGGICEQCCEAEGSVWCMSCTGVHAWCGPCAVKAHRNFPFHKVQRWNGTHYEPTFLMELGFLWHIGHGGDPCPQNCSDPDPDEPGYMTGEEPPITDALECKTSAMSFYQKLKRFTNNAFPERDRYRELMRVSWLWKDLKHRKWFDFGHDMEQDPGDGGLPLFCPACPQPGVNLPADWKVCYDKDTIMRQYVIDGNFTAQHMKMNKPELDVALSDGKGYMVAEVPYQSHLKQSLDSKESLNFIKGAGHLDGEILETLWAPFNKISPTARSMTQAHRQEVYDDHMRGSNWKKLVGMVPSLLKKYKNSNKCLEEMNQAYEQLTVVLDPDKVARAEADRGEALDIYLLKGDKAPSFQEVWLQLMKNPKSPSGNVGLVAWLAEGISIEDSQDQLRLKSDNFPVQCQLGKKLKSLRRDRDFLPDEEEHGDREFWDDDEVDWEAPEGGYQDQEGNPKGGSQGKQAFRSYQRARQALLRLDPDANMAEKYQEILPEDLAVSKEVTEENRFGQGTSKLAWFWVIDGKKSQLNVEAGGLMEEFYRINWLKARARRDRWKEEVSLVRHEMLWTGLWFEYHKKMWEPRALQSTEPGKEAYAKKQMGLWSDFASQARLMFHGKQMDGI